VPISDAIALGLLFLPALFASDAIIEALARRVERRVAEQPVLPIIRPEDRVSHTVSDSDGYLKNWVQFTLAPTLACFGMVPYVTLRYRLGAEAVSAMAGFVALIGLFPVWLAAKYARRLRERLRISAVLEAERRQWDPQSCFPMVIVIHRDICSDSVLFFDALTRKCYEQGFAILQYGALQWPVYSPVYMPGSGNTWTVPHSNPDVVKKASAVVWLDLEKASKATELELQVARGASLPILRVGRDIADPARFVVGTVDHTERSLGHDEVIRCVPDWIRRVVHACDDSPPRSWQRRPD
jgi:hypothetical protein